ncbi:30S ribosomal protein S16 [Candidatus Kaiserbacteria bacterium RIFCSPLOWO2_01_FULL_54_13]|uniref:30S ribosomal protein S16 n=1 Tax=Candidatus Kaiserbacteria bacterium RIFCSPLOWO2_01_FULL_54_13 TaxID=1798512 RepID=A0A1F6F477_9BACT|nr:MAG: 30S ribosomal protein S16 [Candidatus Kaiserbacteria bacterium RIFCSPLOWO2_01_FULL_54_13]
MQRTGRTNMPSFRIVVVEHTESPKTGNVVEKLGTYNPRTKERNLSTERIKYWLSVGAKASDTMHNMLISAGVIEGKKVNVLPRKSPPKPAPTEASGKEETPAEEKTEAPAEETKAKEEPKDEAKSEESTPAAEETVPTKE